jgi:hypothetical protein
MAFIIQFGFVAFLLLTAIASVKASEFPPKPETIKQIIMGTVGNVVVPTCDPRGSTKTVTSTSSYDSRTGSSYGGLSSSFGSSQSTSTSQTFDNTPQRPQQILRIINNSIYDLKDIAVGCFYVAETGTPVEKLRSHTFLLIFPASSRRDVWFSEITPLRYARGLACSVTDFEYIGIGEPPKPEPPRSGASADGTSRPLADDWGVRGRSKVY